jgi:glycosyltransferase involved in cell wall biosynthesis
VVSSAIQSVEEFRNVINVAAGQQEWSNAIEFALSEGENAPHRRAERQRAAREYDWDSLVEKIARIIADRLGLQLPVSGVPGAEQVLTRSS